MTKAYRCKEGVLYREENWPDNLWRVIEPQAETEDFPVIEALFKQRDGTPHPVMSGYCDPDFLAFGVWKPL